MSLLSATIAMMCSTRLIRRFPARESRWRFCSPEEASIGAVPFQEAKCQRVGNRDTCPMSPSSRAAPEGPTPYRSSRVELTRFRGHLVTADLSWAAAVLAVCSASKRAGEMWPSEECRRRGLWNASR